MKFILRLVKRLLWLHFIYLQTTQLYTKVHKSSFIYKNRLKCVGENNSLIIGENVSLKNCSFVILGNNNSITIGNNCIFNGVEFWIEDHGNSIVIGSKTTIESGTQLATCEGSSIVIGEDCMFSHDILIRTTDSHSIIDNRGNRVNCAGNIEIGNHVWLGLQALVLKGAKVPSNIIVGARSIITFNTQIKPGDMLVGAPARTIKQNLSWNRERI